TFGPDKAYGDPGYALIFPVEQFDTSYTFMLAENPVFTGNFVNIIADPAGVATMMLDGILITDKPYKAQFQPIPGSNYVYTQVAFDIAHQGAHNIYSEKPFGITVYALGEVDSYAYPGGSLLKTITPFKTVDLVIDFGDRVMQLGPDLLYHFQDNYWDSTVYLQNISSDPYTINGFATRTGDDMNFLVTRPVTPPSRTIGPGVLDSITIRFQTTVPNQRMHTKINAVTEHLRAYVVDVFGRGIIENAQVYSDSTVRHHIDTLDFGVFDATLDLPKDSVVYISNKGDRDLTINTDGISGVNQPQFSIVAPRQILGLTVTPPFTLHPNNTLSLLDSNAKITLEFDPRGLPNGLYQAEYDFNAQGQPQHVVLLGHIKTIFKSSVLDASFDTAFLCLDESRSIFIDNPNDFPITVTGVDLGGANAGEFGLQTSLPLVVEPLSRGEIKLSFAPLDTTGYRFATATVTFDLPKGYSHVMNFSAYADQLSSSFQARSSIHILPGEETLMPIYAKAPMERLQSPSFILTVWYDSTYIENTNYSQENTLTSLGEYSVNYDVSGFREYQYQTPNSAVITGGDDTTQKPLIYLKFTSKLNGEDKLLFHKDIDIHYRINFDHSPYPDACILSLAPPGRITLDSSCETVWLRQDTFLFPPEAYLEAPRPNPANGQFITLTFDVPTQPHPVSEVPNTAFKLEILTEDGKSSYMIANEGRRPGTYTIRWNASGLVPGMYFVRLQTAGETKIRKLIIQR
ncbi:MAG: T9SS type A sorting domain-containing protein, partial [Ignavibacteriota bacterium]